MSGWRDKHVEAHVSKNLTLPVLGALNWQTSKFLGSLGRKRRWEKRPEAVLHHEACFLSVFRIYVQWWRLSSNCSDFAIVLFLNQCRWHQVVSFVVQPLPRNPSHSALCSCPSPLQFPMLLPLQSPCSPLLLSHYLQIFVKLNSLFDNFCLLLQVFFFLISHVC